MKLSIIVPVFNEEKTILKVIKKLDELSLGSTAKEVIVVDDGSTDSTRKLLQNVKNIKIILHEKNKGKGAAVKTGIKNATGEYIIIQDADLEYDPKYINILLKQILEGSAKVVSGKRLKRLQIFKKKKKKAKS